MKYFLHFFLLISILSCAQGKQPILGETEFQKKMNADFKDASKSPLKDKDRKNFKELDFFKFDSTYVVTATLTRTPDEIPFKMKTTTERMPMYVKYGVVKFELKGKTHELNVYQSMELMNEEGFEDYLFLPFLDTTNGESTYGGGRYIECEQPKNGLMEIDFNTAYNPYCAYNEKYSCPIVPRENYLQVKVEAGVKAFEKH
ncbi:DUF1684 domain-containing protein [Xanthomarina sp. F2636L]|uniref:DUF1684 domain-containing protein n=1 Tax=Xanthomarina sp. F2636L TaxID=2996018 RepID=UPI00225DD737|nr:DUF1684 domain-containing protein [Xanthomarina sp. F2636L]MCX7550532.1 DUF1684 domain-containing protein [Xanthomarina sp. F2636L]